MSDAHHIAILDDDPEIRSLLEQNLRGAGFEVSTASNGRDLKTILEHQTIDLIVLDLMLPGEDGLTICRELRAESNIPIIMLTAMTHEADRIIGLEMGADDYLTKPFSPRELVARIKATLRRQGMVTTQSEDRRRTAVFEGWKLDVVRRELRDPDDVLVFGCEPQGLPADWLGPEERRVYLPIRPGVRSLNLANALAVGLYTALDRAGVPLPDNDGHYEPSSTTSRPNQIARRSEG